MKLGAPRRLANMLKKCVFGAAVVIVLVAGCGPAHPDYTSQIQMLESKIAQLQQQMALFGETQKSSAITNEITTRLMSIVDQHGKVRCQISVNENDASQLTLLTSKGEVGVILGASEFYNGLAVNGWQGTGSDASGITITQNRKLGPSITLSHSNGQPAFSAQVIDGASLMGMASSKTGSKPQIGFRVGPEQEATLNLFDTNHVARALMAVTSQNQPSMGLSDRHGIGRISLQMDKADVPQMALHGSNGQLRGAFGMGSSNNTAVIVIDANGKATKIAD